MSMAIKRASYTGDPGFFGDIFRGAVGLIPGVGTALQGLIPGSKQPPQPVAGPGSFPLMMGADTRCSPGRRWSSSRQRCVATTATLQARGDIPVPGFVGLAQRLLPGGATGMMAAPNGTAMALSGYHPNKSDYFLMSGEFVPAGSRMVKNRKRNPANSRATSRAISRVVGAKKYAASLSRISIRKKC